MGFNPLRAHVARRGDIMLLVIALAVVVALVAWVLLAD
jgi:hypothetical protein